MNGSKTPSNVFANARAVGAWKVLAAAGCVAGLAACSSSDATYRPTPRYTSNSQPTYTSPSATNNNPPPPTPTPSPKKAGGGGCGSKCG